MQERGVVKRDTQYTSTKASATELRFISQPTTVPKLSDLENYVYEKTGGKDIFIYHVELGATIKSQVQKDVRISYVGVLSLR